MSGMMVMSHVCRAEAKAHQLDQYRQEAHEVRQLEQDLSLEYPHGLPVSVLIPTGFMLMNSSTLLTGNTCIIILPSASQKCLV